VEQPTISVESVDRQWWVWLPAGYDQSRAYPLVFLFHGCGDINNNVPMWNETGSDAILVRGAGVSPGPCWDAGPNGPDVTFFDEMLAASLASYCVDSSRVFAAGYSSGSWLINTLECRRGDKLRAAGSVAGGTVNPSDCVGQVARIFVHDLNDLDNAITGNVTERERLLELNQCDEGASPVPEAPAPCERYPGCDDGYPVIWCETMGQGHNRQDDLAPGAFWGLFSEL
jgi:poly(3-hydroxybutyrate) depolymerase